MKNLKAVFEEHDITPKKIITLSGNVAIYNKGNGVSRLAVLTPDCKMLLRGYLGFSADEYWQRISGDKPMTSVNWEETLSKVEAVWPKLAMKVTLPAERLWFTLISDRVIEKEGNTCSARFNFYRSTNFDTRYDDNRDRYDYLPGDFELILFYFHVLSGAGSHIRVVDHIWENGKEDASSPREYILKVIRSM